MNIFVQKLNKERLSGVGFRSSQTPTDKEHFYCRPNADETAGQYGTLRTGLCAGRALLIVQPGTEAQ